MQKPSDQRLREYRDSALTSLNQQTYSTAPITDSLESAMIAENLRFMQRQLGPDNELVKKVLAGKTAEQAAEMYVKTSKLKDVAERKRLAGSLEAVQKSDDGMIRLARLLDPRNRELRRRVADRIESSLTPTAPQIAPARRRARKRGSPPRAPAPIRTPRSLSASSTARSKATFRTARRYPTPPSSRDYTSAPRASSPSSCRQAG